MTPLADYRFADLLEATSAKTPTPGGGAIAGATGALACALAGMVLSYSIGKKDLAAFSEKLAASRKLLDDARAEFLLLADKDAEAYATLNALQKLPPVDPKRTSEMPAAVDAAIGVPLRCLKLAGDVAEHLATLVPITNAYLRSDLAIASVLAEAACRASLCNVRINLPLVEDGQRRATMERQCAGIAARAADACKRVNDACR